MNGHTGPKPEYGRRLLINIIDEIAASDPTRPYAYQPISNNPKDGFRPITYKEIANGINYLAQELIELEQADETNIAHEDFPTVAYIGPSDVRYVVVLFACVKAHQKAFFISPRNSLMAQVALFRATNCTRLLYADSFQSAVQPWLETYPLPATMVPSLDTWLQAEAAHMPYSTPFDEAKHQPMAVLHTSGSTGIPKPIVMRQGSLAVGDGLHNAPDYKGNPSLWKLWGNGCDNLFPGLPLFHTAGIIAMTIWAIYWGMTPTLGPPDRPISADLVTQCIIHSAVDSIILTPSVLEDISLTEEGLKTLAGLRFVAFGGGNLSPATGDKLVESGVNVVNIISSTEAMPYMLQHQSNLKLWRYFILNSEEMGAEFRPFSKDDDGADVYEMWFRRLDPKDPGKQVIFYTFPEKTEWPTGDLYKPHPTLADHWMYQGRADNVIVFSNGEKLNPVTIEEVVMGHPEIKGALVVGERRFQPALILEPHATPVDETAARALVDSVWPFVDKVNEISVAHGHVVRGLITLSDPAKPFQRVPKGTVARHATVMDYKDFIDRIYEEADEGLNVQETVPLELSSKESLTKSIVDAIVSKVGKANIRPATDLFSVGVDSLQVTSISKLLRASLEAAGVSVDQNTVAPRVIYAKSTPQDLAEHLYSTVLSGNSDAEGESRETKALDNIISKYTADLPPPSTNQTNPCEEGQIVIVTGTTGSLGAYMLDQLVSNPRVSKVLAFNRGEDGGSSRQPAYNAARGLTTDFSKVEFYGVDLSQPFFGLTKAKYDEILATADRIIHNAWPVNFNISVTSFEPYIRGVRHLVNFSNKAAKRVPIVFISSIGTALGWCSTEQVPERQLLDLSLPSMGYGQSKLAGSLILDAAVERSGVLGASIRVGQIAGPRAKKGMWNRQEFLPSLIASSVYLGIVPESIGPLSVVDWTAVEDIAGLVLDVAGITETVPLTEISGYFHGVNPSTTSWGEMVQVLKEYYHGRIKEIVPFEQWVQALEQSASNPATADAAKNPGIKLTDMYRRMLDAEKAGLGPVYLDMTRTVAHSPTMKKVSAVDADLMRSWCEQWALSERTTEREDQPRGETRKRRSEVAWDELSDPHGAFRAAKQIRSR